MYDQHTREMATTRHRSLVERGERKAVASVRETALHTTKKKFRKIEISNPKSLKDFQNIQLPSKLLDYFLRSNNSNINSIICIN